MRCTELVPGSYISPSSVMALMSWFISTCSILLPSLSFANPPCRPGSLFKPLLLVSVGGAFGVAVIAGGGGVVVAPAFGR